MKSLGRTSRLVLTVLARGPAHGYGVIRWVKDVSGGTEVLGVGSVYGSIDKLEDRGLIEHDRDEIEQGRTRRYLRITDRGRTALAADVAKLKEEVANAEAALAPHLPGSAGLPGLSGLAGEA